MRPNSRKNRHPLIPISIGRPIFSLGFSAVTLSSTRARDANPNAVIQMPVALYLYTSIYARGPSRPPAKTAIINIPKNGRVPCMNTACRFARIHILFRPAQRTLWKGHSGAKWNESASSSSHTCSIVLLRGNAQLAFSKIPKHFAARAPPQNAVDISYVFIYSICALRDNGDDAQTLNNAEFVSETEAHSSKSLLLGGLAVEFQGINVEHRKKNLYSELWRACGAVSMSEEMGFYMSRGSTGGSLRAMWWLWLVWQGFFLWLCAAWCTAQHFVRALYMFVVRVFVSGCIFIDRAFCLGTSTSRTYIHQGLLFVMLRFICIFPCWEKVVCGFVM